MRAAIDSYTSAVQTALMSNGALMPMPGMDRYAASACPASELSQPGAEPRKRRAPSPRR
ncbi:hypothetical protein GCM10018965_019070 [Nonomuraea roseola]